MDQPTAEKALARLEALVGTWEMEWTWPDGGYGPGHGIATFAWHESRAHLVMTWSLDVPEVPDTTSIIGCDGANDTYTLLSSDERGVSRIYEMGLTDSEWWGRREGLPFAQRFRFTLGDDTMTGGWEMEKNGRFVPDIGVVYRRVA